MALAKAQVVDRLWTAGYESKFYLFIDLGVNHKDDSYKFNQ
ncbi:MAG: hypothetical protein AB4038_20270 [Prochloraceae cyanobacterium]